MQFSVRFRTLGLSVFLNENGQCRRIELASNADPSVSELTADHPNPTAKALFHCLTGEHYTLEAAQLDFSGVRQFDQKIYQSLVKVPFGTTTSYGILAKEAGFPRAARAVGSAMARNPFPLLVPCHRVVPTSGGVGQYAFGRKLKEWLLALESA